jgi:pyridoxal phosphate enzyme (YggS family)
MNTLRQRVESVEKRIRDAEQAASRPSGGVRLLAVSKGHCPEALRALARQVQLLFEESSLQDALYQQSELSAENLEWHFVGPVQSNKTRGIAEQFDWIQSVDRFKILKRLNMQRPEDLPPLNVCLQVNISGEAQKGGAAPEELPDLARAAREFDRLRLRGLMCIPAAGGDTEATRAAFRSTRALYQALREEGHDLDTLSMGMSGDLEAAVAEGSTMVRIGTALFGPRP